MDCSVCVRCAVCGDVLDGYDCDGLCQSCYLDALRRSGHV